MVDYEEQIKQLEEELKNTKYNKRTQHHIGLIKAKIAKLKEKQSSRSSGKSEGFAVKKSGNATVALLGFPSVGKSTLLSNITGKESKTGSYAFTTLTVVPGMLHYKGALIQILDLPGIIRGASKGSGRGREVISVLRQADLILIVLEPDKALEQYNVLLKEVYDSGIRINKVKPDVTIKKDIKGGIKIYKTVSLDLDDDTIKSVLREFKIPNATIIIRDKISIDELIDVIEDNKIYTKGLIVVNKIDTVDKKILDSLKEKIPVDLFISASENINVSVLKQKIFDSLNFKRIFLKEIGKKPDLDEPLILRSPILVRDVCNHLHRDFVDKFKFAKVWGKSSKFPGQKVSLDHVLEDEDILEIHLR